MQLAVCFIIVEHDFRIASLLGLRPLNTKGPSFSAEGKLGKFRDVIEIKSDDYRMWTSHMLAVMLPGINS